MEWNILGQIVEAAFQAALCDELWGNWFPDLAAALGGTGVVAFILDAEQRTVERSVSIWSPARAVDEYFAGYGAYDPQLPLAFSFEGLGTFVDLAGTDTSEPMVADYLKWQRSVANSAHHMTAIVPLGGGGKSLAFSIHREPALGPTPSAAQQALDGVLPDIQRAAALGLRHNEMLQNAFWDGAIVGRADQIAFLIDEQGRVMRHTDAASRLISQRDGLDIRQGVLRPSDPADDRVFARLIGQCIRRTDPRSGTMRVKRSPGKSPYVLVCYPLLKNVRSLAPAEAAAFVTIVDTNSSAEESAHLYRDGFGLSAREAQMAVALMGGHSVESAAAMLGVSMSTARSHMRKLFQKTETSNQASLVRLLGRLG